MAIINATCGMSRSRLKESTCGYSLNQVKDLYLATINEVSAVTTSAATSGCSEEVTGITLTTSAKWAHIQPSKDSASFSDSLQVADRDVRYRTHSVTFSVGGAYDGAAVCDLNALSLGEYAVVAVLSSGNAVLLGGLNSARTAMITGLKATTVELVGAASATEFNGINVEMSADVTNAAMPVSSEALEAIKANVLN